MGATLPAYYASVLITYGTTFFVTAVICATRSGSYTPTRPTIVATLFILFALASLAFTLALSPFSRTRACRARRPALFFLTSQFYNVFLEGESQPRATSEKRLASGHHLSLLASAPRARGSAVSPLPDHPLEQVSLFPTMASTSAPR